jgi:hypothetical protein
MLSGYEAFFLCYSINQRVAFDELTDFFGQILRAKGEIALTIHVAP